VLLAFSGEIFGYSSDMQFSMMISAPREKVWNTLWDDTTFRDWGNIIDEGQYMVGELKEGNIVQFLSASGYGVNSKVLKFVPYEFAQFTQIADTQDYGAQEREQEWTGGTESYALSETDGMTTVTVNIDVPPELEDTFAERFPKALERVKVLAEMKE
jgi:uncharacterized protein YndB with AHSA1/START domain